MHDLMLGFRHNQKNTWEKNHSPTFLIPPCRFRVLSRLEPEIRNAPQPRMPSLFRLPPTICLQAKANDPCPNSFHPRKQSNADTAHNVPFGPIKSPRLGPFGFPRTKARIFGNSIFCFANCRRPAIRRERDGTVSMTSLVTIRLSSGRVGLGQLISPPDQPSAAMSTTA